MDERKISQMTTEPKIELAARFAGCKYVAGYQLWNLNTADVHSLLSRSAKQNLR